MTPALMSAADREVEFSKEIIPLLERFCYDCHDPDDSKGGVLFLDAVEASDIRSMRGVWRNAGYQIRQRTMPPPDKKQMTEDERRMVTTWIEEYLRETACLDGPYAGNVMARRLNRLEYNNTIMDLVGVDLKYDFSLPIDSGAGEGFNNNGSSLFLPPMLMERYVEAAREIVDAAIVSPVVDRTTTADAMFPEEKKGLFKKRNVVRAVPRDDGLSALFNAYVEADHAVYIKLEHAAAGRFDLKIDGVTAHRVKLEKPADAQPVTQTLRIRLARGTHALSVHRVRGELPDLRLHHIQLRSTANAVTDARKAMHERLLGVAPCKKTTCRLPQAGMAAASKQKRDCTHHEAVRPCC
jgi:hypothetical protein